MQFTTRAARRGLAAVAITCAAVLVPTAALAASGGRAAAARPAAASQPTAAVAPRCATGALTVWLGIPGDGAAGSTYFQLELSNTSGKTCTLYGFPGVSAIGRNGGQLGSAANRDYADPIRLVTLRRGATAHVLLQVTDVANFPPASCDPASAVALRVYPPNDRRAAEVPFSFRACRKSGPVYLHVRTTVGGTGIPGFSH
jgi:Protein of unknown function (DUF4232)